MRKLTGVLLGGVVLFLAGPASGQQGKPQVVRELHYPDHIDVSRPLREMPVIPPDWDLDEWEHPVGKLPYRPLSPALAQERSVDPVVQTTVGPLVGTTPGLNFDGVGVGLDTYDPSSAPPDTNGSAGTTQYVQWVNTSFAVFRKSDGAVLFGPAAGSTLWQGFGGDCEARNDGDPIVLFDKAAQRWVMTQFVVRTGNFLQCVAVSTTADATGSYRRFSYSFPNFNDYPKVGIWPDGYYFSFNMFNATGTAFLGGRACVLDRNKMITASQEPAPMQCFQLSTQFGGLLPSDWDGPTPPPAGAPNYFLAFDDFLRDGLNLWKFHVDWATPASSTFAGPTKISGATFLEACFGGTCIPQPATTQRLDSLADRLMYRLAYRNFGTHESLVVNHSVNVTDTTTRSGVRWYEVRGVSGTPTVFQQGTFSPDENFRWMGSIAQDQNGNMLLGYSKSSSTVRPSVFYTGRLATDTPGTMQAETQMFPGTGSQTATLSRWGDYSSMSIDPTDDCTFWFTTEYLKASGTFNWSTRIGSAKFPSCGAGPTPDFSVSVAPPSVSIARGTSGSATTTVTSLNGFSSPVSLSALGLPAGVTASFSPNPVTPPGGGSAGSTLTLTASTSATLGAVTLTIRGTSGSTTHDTSLSLTITAAGRPDFSVSVSPASLSVDQGSSGTATVTVLSINGFAGTVTLSALSLPAGVTASFAPGSVTPPPNGSITSTLTLTASSSAALGSFGVTIRGRYGNSNHDTALTLTVTAGATPDFSVSVSPPSLSIVQGASGTATTTVTSLDGFSSPVSLSALGLPAGVTASFSPNPVTPPGGGSSGSTLTLSASASATVGTVTLTIRGTSGSTTHDASLSLTITSLPAVVVVFYDGAEAASSTFVRSSNSNSTVWLRNGIAPYAGSFRWKGGNVTGGLYGPNADLRLTTPVLNLSSASSAILTYAFQYSTEAGHDFFQVRISTDGGTTWASLLEVSGPSPGYPSWASPLAALDLTPYVGQTNVKIQFRLTTDAAAGDFGVALDEVQVTKQ